MALEERVTALADEMKSKSEAAAAAYTAIGDGVVAFNTAVTNGDDAAKAVAGSELIGAFAGLWLSTVQLGAITAQAPGIIAAEVAQISPP